jgi:uncharacterized protein YndB with AHSA1/START domain
MKAALWLVSVLGTVVVLVFVIGWMLPVAHVASNSTALARPPEAVYAIVSDIASYPKWWTDMSRVEALPPVDGRARFRQHMGADAMIVEVVEAVVPSRFVTRIADPGQPFGGTWTIEIAPTATGSTLSVTERGEVYNPLFRFVSRFVVGHTATINSFLEAVRKATA